MIAANRQKRNKTPPPRTTLWPNKSKGTRQALMQVHREVRMLKLPKSASFVDINNPILSPRKKKMIEAKLQNEREAQKLAQARVEDHKEFISYAKNPFLHLDDPARPPLQQEIKFNKFTKFHDQDGRHLQYKIHKDIVEATNAIKENSLIIGQKKDDQNIKRMSNFSARMSRDVNKKRQFDIERDGEEVKGSEGQMSIDEIARMPEESYYATHQVPINIFKVAMGTHQPFLTNQILQDHFFCRREVRQTIDSQYKVHFLREMSEIGRYFGKGKPINLNPLDYITSYEMSFQLKKLNFSDIMSIASGRFTPELVLKTMQEGDNIIDAGGSSEELQWEIPYNQNTNQVLLNFQARDMERYEVEDYKKMELNSEQHNYERMCQYVMGSVSDNLKQQKGMVARRIRDRKIHGHIKRNVNGGMQNLILLDENRMEIDRKIRHNKQTKNKKEAIKIRKLLQTIQLKSQQQERMRTLLRDIEI